MAHGSVLAGETSQPHRPIVWCVVVCAMCAMCGVYGVCDVWRMVCGVWRVACGVWCMAYGVWCMACGVRPCDRLSPEGPSKASTFSCAKRAIRCSPVDEPPPLHKSCFQALPRDLCSAALWCLGLQPRVRVPCQDWCQPLCLQVLYKKSGEQATVLQVSGA